MSLLIRDNASSRINGMTDEQLKSMAQMSGKIYII